jgi:RNA polymerase sigma-70 factor, ECF subfamily
MATLVDLVEVEQVWVGTFSPAARRLVLLAGEHGHRDQDGDGPSHRRNRLGIPSRGARLVARSQSNHQLEMHSRRHSGGAPGIRGNDSGLVDAITFERGRMVVSPEVTVDQRETVERARRGDHDAFALLVRGSVAQLEAVSRLILRDPELARDAVQDAYIRAWTDLPGLRDPDRFEAWLHRLAVHACLDAVRRRRRRPIEVELTPINPPSVADLSGPIADRDQLERGFRHLSIDQRTVLVLHYYLGMSVPALADTLDIPLGTAQSRLGRALAALRVALGTQNGGEPVPAPRGQMA